MKDLKIGHRVKHNNDGRHGFVVGNPAGDLVSIAIEGSTRQEQWPPSQFSIRPKSQQLISLGGKFKPPTGFPLHIE